METTKIENSKIEMTSASSSENIYNILNSYNSLTLSQPQNAFSQSKSIIDSDIDVQITHGGGGYYAGIYKECSSELDLSNKLSVSLGVKGTYELYSGSFNGTFKTSYQQRTTSFNSKWDAVIDHGAAEFGKSNADILGCLEQSLQTSLNSIATLNDAKSFVDQYGTHLITKVARGGYLYIGIQANSQTESEQQSINSSVSVAYKGLVNSVSGTIGVISSQASKFSQQQLTQKIIAVGGNPFVGGSSDTSGLENWANNVTDESVRGILGSIPFWSLPGVNSSAAAKLQEYVQYQLLINSIEKPLIVSNTGLMTAGQVSSVSTKILPEGYKIVGGGAATEKNGNNFLMGSYPNFLGSTDIQQWTADAHDCMFPSGATDIVTSYVVAIYDPFDLMKVHVSTSSQTSTQAGGMQILQAYYNPNNVPYPTVTGGGLKTTILSGSYTKYVTTNVFQWNGWYTQVHDYADASSDIQLDAYAITITIPSGIVNATTNFTDKTITSEWVSIDTPVPAGKYVVGGGSGIVKSVTGSDGSNLYRQCFPNKDTNEFHSYSSDLDGQGNKVEGITRALYLEASFANMNS